MPKRIDLVLCCAREAAPLPMIIAPALSAPSRVGDGPCRAMMVSTPFARTREQLDREHQRCDRHNRPIVVVFAGAARDLPPVDEERAPC